MRKRSLRTFARWAGMGLVIASALSLSSCGGSVGVGVSVGVPVGNHGHMSIGTGRWF
jgi:hypothetical protein